MKGASALMKFKLRTANRALLPVLALMLPALVTAPAKAEIANLAVTSSVAETALLHPAHPQARPPANSGPHRPDSRFIDLVGITNPIIQAPMLSAGAEVVAIFDG